MAVGFVAAGTRTESVAVDEGQWVPRREGSVAVDLVAAGTRTESVAVDEKQWMPRQDGSVAVGLVAADTHTESVAVDEEQWMSFSFGLAFCLGPVLNRPRSPCQKSSSGPSKIILYLTWYHCI